MLWFWIGAALAAGVLSTWVKYLAVRPGADPWIRKITAAPFIVLGLSVGPAVYFTWKAFHVVEAADASQKAALMAQNISWAMNATLAGIIGLGAIAILLLVITLKRRMSR